MDGGKKRKNQVLTQEKGTGVAQRAPRLGHRGHREKGRVLLWKGRGVTGNGGSEGQSLSSGLRAR